MGDRKRSISEAFFFNGIGMILGSDLNLSCQKIFHRMVSASVAEFELVGPGTIGQREDLMAKADSENGEASDQGADSRNGLRDICGISRSIGQKDPVRLQCADLVCRRIPGQHRHSASPAVEGADNISLHSAVDSSDPKGSSCGRGYGIQGVQCKGRFRSPGIPAAHPGNSIGRKYCTAQNIESLCLRHIRIRDQGLPCPVIPDRPGQGACVHPSDSGNSVGLHHLPQRLKAAEIGRLIIVFAHDQGTDRGGDRFIILYCHPVITDQRIGHNDRLIRVGQIRQNLLIARHGSVENYLAYPVTRSAEGISEKFPSVLQNDFSIDRLVHVYLPCRDASGQWFPEAFSRRPHMLRKCQKVKDHTGVLITVRWRRSWRGHWRKDR